MCTSCSLSVCGSCPVVAASNLCFCHRTQALMCSQTLSFLVLTLGYFHLLVFRAEVFHAHPVARVQMHAQAHSCVHSRSNSWLHTDNHDSSCLAGSGDGDCGFRALLVATLLQVCCYGPAMGASMAARMKVLFEALPEWTRKPAVVAGYSTLKVTVLATCAPFGCESECLMTA
jgi:hypothetical protein